jgi:hypothetical protein
VAAVVVLLVAARLLVRVLPAQGAPVSATALLARVEGSRDRPFTAYAVTDGAVRLPVDDTLTGLGRLLGSSSTDRVWWQDRRTWRVATLRPTGETDLVHHRDRMVEWTYESRSATTVPDVEVRLPRTTDLLPQELARRVLSGARPAELSRLPARRVGGRDALGLRLRPADPQAAIRRVDVYVDRVTAVPLSVTMYSHGVRGPSLTSRFLQFSPGRPDPATLRFVPPPGADQTFDGFVDIASAVDRFADREPPARLGGLPARAPGVRGRHGSVGVYGRGPTVLLALPLWSRSAHRVHDQLSHAAGAVTTEQGLLLGAPPLHLLLADPEHNGTRWLLAGTVTPRTLAAAARQLATHRPSLQGPL